MNKNTSYPKSRKVRMFVLNSWVKILIATIVGTLVFWLLHGLLSLDSYARNYMLTIMPLHIILGLITAGAFVSMYVLFLHGGLARIRQNRIKGETVNVHFSDVIGLDEAKEEAREIVELIKDRTRIKKIGGKILRGILMVGPPGCGKTYLAKSIATECGIPFLSVSASEFVEIFVGVGASRVRKLFKKSRRLAYGYGACMIFIDELDAIGRHRLLSWGGGGQETNTTQNQLLVEMDGLKQKDENIIIIGATNAPEESLDEALLRPGRFDRKIYIGRPTLSDREKLFQYYLSKVKYSPEVDVARLARRTVYKTPADIENIIKESALIATRNKKDMVENRELSEALERIEMGIKHKSLKMTPQEKKTVAYHEAGHLLVLYILHPTDDVFKASIISRRGALGMVHHLPREEIFTSSRERILANIKVALGGYMAEKIKFGITSDGVSADFRQAMLLAHNMVWKYGMGNNGYLGDFTAIPKNELSDNLREQLNKETNQIIQECAKEVEKLLNREVKIFERFAQELLKKDELEYDEIDAIFAEYGKSHKQLNQQEKVAYKQPNKSKPSKK